MSLLFNVVSKLSASSVVFFTRRILYTDVKDPGDEKDNLLVEPCISRKEELEIKEKGKNAMKVALVTLLSSDGWKRENEKDSNDVIESKRNGDGNKIFRAKAVINTSSDNLIDILFEGFQSQPEWNPTVQICTIIEKLDSDTDLVYTVSAPACQGMVSSRDFVVVRQKAVVDKSIIIASVSVQLWNSPKSGNYVRGENGPSAFLITPVPGKSKQCELLWLLDSKLNGWLPQSLVDSAFNSVIQDYFKYLRKYIQEKKG